MQTRYLTVTVPQTKVPPNIESFNLEEPLENQAPPVVTMTVQCTMAQLLQAPIEGYEDAIVPSGSIIKVRYSRDKAIVSKFSTSSSTPGVSHDVSELKDMVRALLLDKKNQSQAPATVKAVEESCVTCGGAHSYRNYPATDGNVYRDNIQEYVSQAAAVNYNQGNTSYRPLMILNNKDKIIDLIKTPVNENCSVVILKKFPEKLGDPGRFLIPCDFAEMDECLALADLGASINLMPLSVWENLNLLDLTKTRMILELADRTISTPTGIVEDVFVKVGTFLFPADFVVVDYIVDPRVPLILRRRFLRSSRCFNHDVHGVQMTFVMMTNQLTFKVGDTKTFSYNTIESANRVDVIDVACEEFSQEVLGFLNISKSGNPTPTLEPILSTSPTSLTPFEGSDFILEEIEACLTNESIPPGIDDADFDPKEDLLTLERLLNSDPTSTLLRNEPKKLMGTDKLPVIIAKDLKDKDKTALLKVLRSHKRAIAWKMSDINGIDPKFCTHKILMEDNVKPTMQHPRRVNPKIHEVIISKKLSKLLDAGLIIILIPIAMVNRPLCAKNGEAFNALKKKLTEAPILVAPDWDLPFEIMCDASDFAILRVERRRKNLLRYVIKECKDCGTFRARTCRKAKNQSTTLRMEEQARLSSYYYLRLEIESKQRGGVASELASLLEAQAVLSES
ncbi:reverse transcriptase domain-containing protein [Tanacetum coccineum]